jgi:hypothetical protein
MSILSTTEAKLYLGITSTEYDNLIAAYIPMVIQEFFDHTNNYFDNNTVKLTSNSIVASSSDRTIIVSNTNFSTWSFLSGDEIRIRDSARNDGFYTAATVSSATITVSSSSDYVATYTLRNEALQEACWIITKIDVPMNIKPLLAAMVKFKIDNPFGTPQSESLGDYSVTYGNSGSGYPSGITSAINRYRLVKFI